MDLFAVYSSPDCTVLANAAKRTVLNLDSTQEDLHSFFSKRINPSAKGKKGAKKAPRCSRKFPKDKSGLMKC